MQIITDVTMPTNLSAYGIFLGYLHIATLHTVQVATTIQSIEALISKEILRKVPRSATFLVSYCNSLLNLLTGYSNLI